jgi:hypothetical protein
MKRLIRPQPHKRLAIPRGELLRALCEGAQPTGAAPDGEAGGLGG